MNIFLHILIATAVTLGKSSDEPSWRLKRNDYHRQLASRIGSMPPFLQDIVRHIEKLYAQVETVVNRF